jgi:hypothetical protein
MHCGRLQMKKTSPLLASPGAARRGYGLLIGTFVLLMIAGIVWTDSAESFIGYALMTAASIVPVALWMLQGSSGLPVFPMMSCIYFIYYALPILRPDPGMALYSGSEILNTSITVSLFIGAATIAWQAVLSTRKGRKGGAARVNVVTRSQLTGIIIFGLGLSVLYFVTLLSGYLSVLGSLFGLVRSILLAATSVSSFLLGHAVARGFIQGPKLVVAVACLTLVVLLSWSTLFLVAGIVYTSAALFGYVVTSRRIPWLTFAIVGSIIIVLHAGKGEMRQRHWVVNSNMVSEASILQTPALLTEWAEIGIGVIVSGDPYSNAVDRASLLKLLMRVERLAPEHVPFLQGETYSYLPYMLVPRFVQEDKVFSQASMTLLNIRFGFQSEQAASITAIGWGLVAEAYANYGSIAVVAVGLIIGTFTGLLTRWSDGASTLSAPTLVTIAAMMLLINVEEDFSYLFTNLFQSCVSILIFFVAFNSLNGMQKTTIRRRAPVS